MLFGPGLLKMDEEAAGRDYESGAGGPEQTEDLASVLFGLAGALGVEVGEENFVTQD